MNNKHPHRNVSNWSVVNESYTQKKWKNTHTGERIQLSLETGPFEEETWTVRVYSPDEVELLETQSSREEALNIARDYATSNNT